MYIFIYLFIFSFFRIGTQRGTLETQISPSASKTQSWCGYHAFICGYVPPSTSCISTIIIMGTYV